ncbi:MAG: PAS domain S-box protein [Methylobacter sp.]|nr:MAG: PAS domain S-box protein [Methylobacter sp.]
MTTSPDITDVLEAHVSIALTAPIEVLSVTDSIEDLLGFEAGDFLTGRASLKDRIHAHDRDIADDLFSIGIDNSSGAFNVRIRQANGRIRCIKAHYSKAPDTANADVVILELLLQDAKSLSKSQCRIQGIAEQAMMFNFKAMMENTDDYIYFKDSNHVFTGASQTLVSITEPTEHWTDLLGLTDYDVFAEAYADIYYSLEKQVFSGAPLAQEEQETLDNKGNKGWVDNRKYPIKNEAGDIVGLFGIARDITERKQAELAKHRSEEQLQAFYELDLVGLAITSPEKGWIRTNECLCKMLEYSEQTLRQMSWEQLTYPDDLDADVEQFDRLLANEINGYALEKRFVSRTGKVISTKLVVRSVRNSDGELDYVVAMLEDISEYKQAEAELKRSNAELEQFAYAVSHDMRQPLRMVTSYLALIENALGGLLNEETQQFLAFAMDGAKRMDAMILSLLDYSRVGRKTEAKTLISSKASLDEALAFLYPELSACGGEIKLSGDWPELFASRDELTRLLQNLIGNAVKYHEQNQPPQVHVHGAICAGSLRVEVRDQGIGINPKQMDRLFKVFSRLQARSRFDGAGVGLALCRKIVEHHGGAIGVESAGEGQGCVFWFELPLQMNMILSA